MTFSPREVRGIAWPWLRSWVSCSGVIFTSARRVVECKGVAGIKRVITILYNLVEIHLIKTFQAWYPVICPDHAKTQRETTASLSVLRLLICLR